MKHPIYLGLGSNLGDRYQNLAQAIVMLEPQIHPERTSSIYQTAPWGYADQPPFLNCAVMATTCLSPKRVLNRIKKIEAMMGRKQAVRYGPRLIDIDILLYSDRILSTPDLVIPHPSMNLRAFVLVPLAEIAGDFLHPIEGISITNLLKGLDTSGVERYTPHQKGDEQ